MIKNSIATLISFGLAALGGIPIATTAALITFGLAALSGMPIASADAAPSATVDAPEPIHGKRGER
jgi:hypothetical protein